MTAKQKKTLVRILCAAALYAVYLIVFRIVSAPWYAELLCSLIPYGVIGWDVVFKAARGIGNKQIFDEQFLMVVATIGAFGVGEYSEAVAVMLFYQVGEWFQSYAVGRSRKSISDLMDIVPEYANIEEDGEIKQVDPDDVEVGAMILIRPGERIPLDGIVEAGTSQVDTSALTGESVPRVVRPGDEVISGCVNGGEVLRVRTTKEFEDSTVSRILELVEDSAAKKGRVENFITRFARYYTPAVVIAAVVLAILPPLFLGGLQSGAVWLTWIRRACIFLVISCPCALVISVPLSFFGGIGAASSRGILVKGSTYMEQLAKLDTVVFDKTGTLTRGTFTVTGVYPAEGISEAELLETAAYGEFYSNHPIARSIRDAAVCTPDPGRLGKAEELAGRGIRTTLDGKTLLAGNRLLLSDAGIGSVPVNEAGTVVYLALDGRYLGAVLISDTVKEDAAEAIAALKRVGVTKTVMLTGDRRETGEAVGRQLGIDRVHTELLPGDKVALLEDLLKEAEPGRKLAFVGDGINDAPVLTRADVGIAMGAMGSDAAIEAADVVLMDDNPGKIPVAVTIAKKTVRIAWENIVFALGIKLLFLILGALGIANMWEAVFADVGVAVIAILNAMRAMKVAK